MTINRVRELVYLDDLVSFFAELRSSRDHRIPQQAVAIVGVPETRRMSNDPTITIQEMLQEILV